MQVPREVPSGDIEEGPCWLPAQFGSVLHSWGSVDLLSAGQDGFLDEGEDEEDPGAFASLALGEVVGDDVVCGEEGRTIKYTPWGVEMMISESSANPNGSMVQFQGDR